VPIGPALFFDLDGVGATFASRLSYDIFKMSRDYVVFDDGQQFIFVVLKDFRAQFVAIAVAHTLAGNRGFHVLSWLYRSKSPVMVK
jgi:hypothetical protein